MGLRASENAYGGKINKPLGRDVFQQVPRLTFYLIVDKVNLSKLFLKIYIMGKDHLKENFPVCCRLLDDFCKI